MHNVKEEDQQHIKEKNELLYLPKGQNPKDSRVVENHAFAE